MNLIRRDPIREIDEFFNRFAPAFGRWPRMRGEEEAPALEWSPAADITETEAEFLVKAELPGIRREDVQVTVDNGVVSLQGERKLEKEDKGERLHRIERSYGAFYRSFALPENVAATDIRAECKDGVLTVHLPKVKVEKAKAIEVRVE